MNRSSLKAAALVLVTLFAGCGGGGSSSPTTPPTTDAISIVTISPAAGTALKQGVDQTFTATVNYTLNSAASGSVLIIFEDQNFNPLNGHEVTKSVTGGPGSTTISDHIVVPFLQNSGVTQVQVFLSLLPAGATTTKVTATATYPTNG